MSHAQNMFKHAIPRPELKTERHVLGLHVLWHVSSDLVARLSGKSGGWRGAGGKHCSVPEI